MKISHIYYYFTHVINYGYQCPMFHYIIPLVTTQWVININTYIIFIILTHMLLYNVYTMMLLT